MANRIIKIDPVCRVSGLLSIQIKIEQGRIVDARSGGMQIRGFEHMLQGRYPLDTIRLTARTCGICSCAHSVASSIALEMALGVTPDRNGMLLRDMALGFETVQNNIRQTYQFLMPDYVDVTGVSPIYKIGSIRANDYRLPKELNERLAAHYMDAITFARKAHQAEAIIAGKAPHNHGVFVGGITTSYDILQYTQLKALLRDISEFVHNTMQEDLQILMKYYPEYRLWGQSDGNYLSYGIFKDLSEKFRIADPGVLTQGTLESVDLANIRESLAYTWLKSEQQSLAGLHEPPDLDFQKPGAYSWVTAPRYQNLAYEVGPLADCMVNGWNQQGTGTLGRINARYLITKKMIEQMENMLERIQFQPAYQEEWQIPETGEGYAMIGAPRGGLLHWLTIEQGRIKNYTLLPPSTWNMSPMDQNDIHGAVEQALIGTPTEDMDKVETIVGRIVRSFDPCLNCAAHIVSDRRKPFDFEVI